MTPTSWLLHAVRAFTAQGHDLPHWQRGVNIRTPFQHIDWCTSEGGFNEDGCDCPGSDIDKWAARMVLPKVGPE